MQNWRKLGLKALIFRFAIRLPYIKGIADKEGVKILEKYSEQYKNQRKDSIKVLPLKSTPLDVIMKRVLKGEKDSKHCYLESRISGAVYIGDQQHWDFVNDIMKRYVVTNALHADEYYQVTQMESEIVRMVINMYNGEDTTCGLTTSGGTESILLAILAYREEAKLRGVTKPNIVMS